MSNNDRNELAEQEKMMKQMVQKEMLIKIETKIKTGDKKILNHIKNLILEDEENIRNKYKQ
jgi:hypothetical protein